VNKIEQLHIDLKDRLVALEKEAFEAGKEAERCYIKINEQRAKIKQLKEAAEIFRDFGDFQHLHRKFDLKMINKARTILRKE